MLHFRNMKLMQGTPRDLIEKNQTKSRVTPINIMFSWSKHRELSQVSKLFPPNTLIGSNEELPGMAPS